MKVSAFSYIRNGIQFDYPFLQSLQSILPIVDEFVMVVGDSTDGTREAIEALNSGKIVIIDSVWDMNLRKGGKLFAQQSNLGLNAVTGDWVIHVQADEVIHENDIWKLREYIVKNSKDSRVEALLFPFLNFRGDYDHIHTGRKAHRFEIRAFKFNKLIRSYKDSQGFRKYSSQKSYENGEAGEKLKVVKIDVPIYHYNYVRPPKQMKIKSEFFSRFWDDDNTLKRKFEGVEEFEYNEVDQLKIFSGTHPQSMLDTIKKKDWEFHYDPSKANISLRHRILNEIENLTGWRVGEFKNYKLIK
ncbi:MAG: glycosyltransferase [Cyclobacteriaceae bacterium]